MMEGVTEEVSFAVFEASHIHETAMGNLAM
jgi:hypothetical protein